MKEYQAVMLRLTHHPRDDEDALTDLLNERSRGGWEPALMAHSGQPGGERLTVIFERVTGAERVTDAERAISAERTTTAAPSDLTGEP